MTEFKIGFHHGRRGSFEFNHPFYIHPSAYIDNTDDIWVGPGVSISRNVEIYTHDHYHDKPITYYVNTGHVKTSSLKIGKNAYIGASVIILEKVNSIGENSIIGAGSVVTKDILPGEIWAGNPAKKIGDVERTPFVEVDNAEKK